MRRYTKFIALSLLAGVGAWLITPTMYPEYNPTLEYKYDYERKVKILSYVVGSIVAILIFAGSFLNIELINRKFRNSNSRLQRVIVCLVTGIPAILLLSVSLGRKSTLTSIGTVIGGLLVIIAYVQLMAIFGEAVGYYYNIRCPKCGFVQQVGKVADPDINPTLKCSSCGHVWEWIRKNDA